MSTSQSWGNIRSACHTYLDAFDSHNFHLKKWEELCLAVMDFSPEEAQASVIPYIVEVLGGRPRPLHYSRDLMHHYQELQEAHRALFNCFTFSIPPDSYFYKEIEVPTGKDSAWPLLQLPGMQPLPFNNLCARGRAILYFPLCYQDIQGGHEPYGNTKFFFGAAPSWPPPMSNVWDGRFYDGAPMRFGALLKITSLPDNLTLQYWDHPTIVFTHGGAQSVGRIAQERSLRPNAHSSLSLKHCDFTNMEKEPSVLKNFFLLFERYPRIIYDDTCIGFDLLWSAYWFRGGGARGATPPILNYGHFL